MSCGRSRAWKIRVAGSAVQGVFSISQHTLLYATDHPRASTVRFALFYCQRFLSDALVSLGGGGVTNQ